VSLESDSESAPEPTSSTRVVPDETVPGPTVVAEVPDIDAELDVDRSPVELDVDRSPVDPLDMFVDSPEMVVKSTVAADS